MFNKIIVVNNLIKLFFLKKKLMKENIYISKKTTIVNTTFENSTKIGPYCNLNNSKIGFGTYIGNNTSLPNTEIGRYCSIAQKVTVAVGNHPTSKFVSTHPSFFSTLNQAGFYFLNESIFKEFKYAKEKYLVKIGNDVWIGTNVTILSGVTIGDGAIIGAGSVVTKNIEPYTINVGVPVRAIKKRFSEEDISFLLELNWWDKDFEWIKEHAKYFSDIKLIKSLLKK